MELNMKQFITILVFISISIFIFQGCSDLNNNITPPQVSKAAHQPGILDKASPNFHGNLIKNANWNMKTCRQCHDREYTGGLTGVSCLNCHTEIKGPEACNTCHGKFNDANRIAPPREPDGDTLTTSPGVGAHVSHLYSNSLGSTIECNTCHVVPDSVYQEGHLNPQIPGGVIFALLSVHNGANPEFDSNNYTCSNTYCHGNFTFFKDSAAAQNKFIYNDSVTVNGQTAMLGNNKTVKWTKVDGTEAQCGSCHGLPPEGHKYAPLKDCAGCHVGVIDSDGNIIDQSKHINGVINVFGN